MKNQQLGPKQEQWLADIEHEPKDGFVSTVIRHAFGKKFFGDDEYFVTNKELTTFMRANASTIFEEPA